MLSIKPGWQLRYEAYRYLSFIVEAYSQSKKAVLKVLEYSLEMNAKICTALVDIDYVPPKEREGRLTVQGARLLTIKESWMEDEVA